jgi:hypothetical protein
MIRDLGLMSGNRYKVVSMVAKQFYFVDSLARPITTRVILCLVTYDLALIFQMILGFLKRAIHYSSIIFYVS